MINKPSIEQLEKKIGMRYIVVLAASKRARDITAGATPFYEGKEENPLTIATKELFNGHIKVTKNIHEE